jgi:hypothetical protein
MDISEFPNQKRAIFRKIKEIKELRGDVPWYVAQEIPLIDTEIAEKSRFRTETNYGRNFYKRLDCVKLSPSLAVPARIFHESLAATTDMAVLPGVLGGKPIFVASRQQFMKYPG